MAPISFNPESFAQGGGLLDDVDVVVKEASFVLYDYNGNAPEPVPALLLVLQDREGAEHPQYFSAGNSQFFVPSDDGTTLEPVGDKTAVSATSNFGLFMASLVNAGFPANLLDSGNIKVLEGVDMHVNRVAQPKRSGIIRTGKNAEREATRLECTKINAMPGKAGAKAGAKVAPKPTAAGAPKTATAAGKPNGKPAPAPAATGGNELDEELTGILVEVLAEAGGALPKAKVSQAIFAKAAGNPNRSKFVGRVFKDEFLESAEGITFDGTTISLA